MKIVKISKITACNKKDCGGFQKAKGHLDTQMFPECEGTKYDRNIVKKTVENRKKKYNKHKNKNKQKEACSECVIKEAEMIDPKLPQRPIFSGDKCPKCGNAQHYIANASTPIINECSLCKHTWNPDNEKWTGKMAFNLKKYKTAQLVPFPPATFTYHINLDERGSFFADVRNSNGKTVFEIKAGNELKEDESSIFEDGYMKNKTDLVGLKDYLVQLGIMNQKQTLMMG